MHDVELFLALLLAVAALAGLARAIGLSYPLVGLGAGLILGAVPGLPAPRLDPELVFLLFLPPLLFSAAFLSSPTELRARAREISVLAIGLVLASVVAVAAVGHALLGLPWPVAFVLGAILSPTDPVAAVSVLRKAGAPPDVATVLEGEALVNDGTALTAYKVALGAIGGGFSLLGAGGELVAVALGGIAIGLLAGHLSVVLRSRIEDPQVDVTLSLLTPFVAYIPAEELGVSGVLAAVAAGVLVGARALDLSAASTRVRTRGVWEVLTFLLESSLFLLVGLEVPKAVDAFGVSGWELAGYIAALTATLVAVRIGCVVLLRPGRSWRERTVHALGGIRGAISVAAALALPLDVPHRDLLVAVVTGVVLATLVPTTLGLPWLIRRLGLVEDGERRREEARAQLAIVHAALRRIDAAAEAGEAPQAVIANLRDRFEWRAHRLENRLSDEVDREAVKHGREAKALRREVVEAEREALEELVRDRRVDAPLADRLKHDLDVEASRVE